jgi:hypothetical protein
LNNEAKFHETVITFKVLGHLIGDGPNEEKPKVVVRENFVDVKFPRTRTMFGDKPTWTDTPFDPDGIDD